MSSGASPARQSGRPVAEDTAGGSVFTAWWCCSVGTTWTVELRSVDRSRLGRPLEWICSGIPTEQPVPEQHLDELLRERGLLLFPVDPPRPRTRSRKLIGYITRDQEVMRLARSLRDTRRDADSEHPLLIAAWIHARRSTPRRITIELTPGASLE